MCLDIIINGYIVTVDVVSCLYIEIVIHIKAT